MEHHVCEGGGPSGPGDVVLPPARNPSFSQRKKPLYQVHSGFFHILCFFLRLQIQIGEARAAPRRSAAPSPHRRSLLIGEAYASRAYIGRLGMCTVKVVPLPGMLST